MHLYGEDTILMAEFGRSRCSVGTKGAMKKTPFMSLGVDVCFACDPLTASGEHVIQLDIYDSNDTHVQPRNTVYLAVFPHIEAEQTGSTLSEKSSKQVLTMLSNALDLKVAKKLKITPASYSTHYENPYPKLDAGGYDELLDTMRDLRLYHDQHPEPFARDDIRQEESTAAKNTLIDPSIVL